MLAKNTLKIAILLSSLLFFGRAFSADAEFCYALNTNLGHYWVPFAYNKDDNGMSTLFPLYRLYLKHSQKAICFSQNANVNGVKLVNEGKKPILEVGSGSKVMSAGFYRLDPFAYTATYMSKYMYEFHLKNPLNCARVVKMTFRNVDSPSGFSDKDWKLSGDLSFNYDGGLYATSHMMPSLIGGNNIVLRSHIKINGKDLPTTGLPPGVYDVSVTGCHNGQALEMSFNNKNAVSQTHFNDIKNVFSSP